VSSTRSAADNHFACNRPRPPILVAMSAIDDTEVILRQQLARQTAENHQLRRVILWQAEGGHRAGSWIRQSSTLSRTREVEQALPTNASQPLVWVRVSRSLVLADPRPG
jgi:hypothetical protein